MRRRACLLAVVGALSLVLAACGGSPSGSQGVTVGISTPNINLLPLWLADQKGYFARAGLTVKIALLTPATTNTALNSGSVQFLDGSPNNFLIANNQGTGQLAVMQTAQGIPLGLVVSKKFATDHTLTKQTPPKAVAQALVGATGGSASESTTGQADLFLRENGVRVDQTKIATLASPKAYLTALQQGQVDWFSTSEPTPMQAEAQGAGIVVASPRNVTAWSPSKIGIGSLLVTSKKYAKSSPDTVRKFVQATSSALRYISVHKGSEDVVDVAEGQLPGVPRTILKQVIDDIDWGGTGAMSAELWDTTARFITQLGVVPKDTKVTADDWTNEYLKN